MKWARLLFSILGVVLNYASRATKTVPHPDPNCFCPFVTPPFVASPLLAKWEILIPPSKFPPTEMESRWSKALESVRKDVECFFGILKGRFRILKLGILFQDLEDIDNMFFTCCALHNMLHAFDGLDDLEPTVEWGGKEGLHDPWDHPPQLDESTTGSTSRSVDDDDSTTVTVAAKKKHFELKNALIDHFEVRRQQGSIKWLRHKAPGRRHASRNVEISDA